MKELKSVYLCPVCLNSLIEKAKLEIECPYCTAKMVDGGKGIPGELAKLEQALKNSEIFNEEIYDQRMTELDTPERRERITQIKKELMDRQAKREALEREARYGKQAEGEVHCPYCNSTQIQLVRRKWSLLAGFATNKVDRVCVNCKKKF